MISLFTPFGAVCSFVVSPPISTVMPVILEANAVTSSHSEIIYLRLLAFDKEMRYTIDKGV